MDGELWAGRGQFAVAQAAVAQAVPDEAQWRSLRYMVFDLPAAPDGFGVRLPALQRQMMREVLLAFAKVHGEG